MAPKKLSRNLCAFSTEPIISREKFSCQENEEDLQEIRSAYKIVPDKNGRRKKMQVEERLMRYITVKTPCDENVECVPTTKCQFDLAEILVRELKELGIEDARLDAHCFVYGTLKATEGYENRKKIGFIAHMDTVSEFCEGEITPVRIENYDGEDVKLKECGRVISTEDFPHLKEWKGRTLITSDGRTILGVDDKAGIAEIMEMLRIIIEEEIPHGQISVAFTPDEECGAGAAYFDFDAFDADVAYTLDGDGEGEIQYQNFNACEAKFTVEGKSVHPGSAKNVMINAVLLAAEINQMLPKYETPRYTEGYEGFYHLLTIHGDESHAVMEYIVRDHDETSFRARKETLRHIEKSMNEIWGEGTVSLELKDEYKNMECIVKDHFYLIEHAKKACELAGAVPVICPIRGGTDGCKLSFKGLPCPNLGTGGHGYHGPLEHVSVEGMEKAVQIIVELVKIFAEK